MYGIPSGLAGFQAIVESHKAMPGALLPILHAIQDDIGYISDEAISLIASSLSLSRAEVQGVISFYPHFRARPPGRHILQICRAESCQAMGAQEIEARARQLLNVDWHETTPDGAVTLEPVYCLGNCACSPAVCVDGDMHGRVSSEALTAIISELRQSP